MFPRILNLPYGLVFKAHVNIVVSSPLRPTKQPTDQIVFDGKWSHFPSGFFTLPQVTSLKQTKILWLVLFIVPICRLSFLFLFLVYFDMDLVQCPMDIPVNVFCPQLQGQTLVLAVASPPGQSDPLGIHSISAETLEKQIFPISKLDDVALLVTYSHHVAGKLAFFLHLLKR